MAIDNHKKVDAAVGSVEAEGLTVSEETKELLHKAADGEITFDEARKKVLKTVKAKASYVYHHDCPIFGEDTIVPRALLASPDSKYVLAYQHKCLCGHTAGEKKLAPGVTQNLDGTYSVDITKAETMQ